MVRRSFHQVRHMLLNIKPARWQDTEQGRTAFVSSTLCFGQPPSQVPSAAKEDRDLFFPNASVPSTGGAQDHAREARIPLGTGPQSQKKVGTKGVFVEKGRG